MQYYLVAAGAAPVAAGAEPAAGTGRSSRSQPMWLAPVAPVAAGTEPAVRGALVDTSVYLKTCSQDLRHASISESESSGTKTFSTPLAPITAGSEE